ncbi:hypothetical protein PoB_001883300 [Plakobranchus ocellatus]|uniref:Uncharacterized protein n=1 Tax=Plakobranchus ocellatus TaxID=259542 RepID=A0AAV3ZC57_9GAST|nr:hypothetical protein PoB_001883300 [Plakobranchus ocellatus]
MLEDSEDAAMRSFQPHLRTGRKWKVGEAVNQTIENLKMKEPRAQVFTSEGGIKSWCGSAASMNTQRKSLLDGCVASEFSADLHEWNSHPRLWNEA